jgi:DNA mismatch repair ATPase MutS
LSDIESVELLEIIYSHNKAFPNYSLYNALNKCITSLGKKLLRTSLLQPLYNKTIINKRIESVVELVSNPSLLIKLQVIIIIIYKLNLLYIVINNLFLGIYKHKYAHSNSYLGSIFRTVIFI